MQQQRLDNRIEQLLQHLTDGQEGTTPDDSAQPTIEDEPVETIHVYFVRERDEQHEAVVESTLASPQQPASVVTAAMLLLCLLLPLASILVQLVLAFHPPIATVTIIPKSQTVTLTGTVQLGRLLNQITISQSRTTKTTGTGHQSAAQARGSLTFYNGQFQSVTIATGTILTSASGIEVVTDEDAYIPAANPPSFGYTTVSAHALSAGSNGNIPAYDIHEACCATSVLAKNTEGFTGGQDARTYTTVTQQDIHNLSTVLKTTLAQSITGALQGQLQPAEQLQLLPCNPTVTSDHQAGEEATTVKVTVSQTCSAVAYSIDKLETKATAYLATQAQHTTGAGYSVFRSVYVWVKQATGSSTPHPLVFLSFQARGTWVYALSRTTQEQIKSRIAGKSTQQAERLLASLPGIARATLHFSGIGDDTRIPRSTQYIHLVLLVV